MDAGAWLTLRPSQDPSGGTGDGKGGVSAVQWGERRLEVVQNKVLVVNQVPYSPGGPQDIPRGPWHKHKPRGHRKEQGPEETDLEQRTLDGARGSIPSVSASSQGPTIACSSSRPHYFHLQGKLETLVLVSRTRSSGRCKAKCPCCHRASTTPQPPGAYWVQGSSMEWGRCAAL